MGATIYLHYPGKDEAVAVASGFSWGACLLGFIWALSKKMWFAAFVMLAINLILFGMGLWGETADLIGLKPELSCIKTEDEGLYIGQHEFWLETMKKAFTSEQANGGM